MPLDNWLIMSYIHSGISTHATLTIGLVFDTGNRNDTYVLSQIDNKLQMCWTRRRWSSEHEKIILWCMKNYIHERINSTRCSRIIVRQINGIFFLNLEVRFKLFFLMDSCSPHLAFQESDWCHLGIIEHFEIFKMAAKMVAKYNLFLVFQWLWLKKIFFCTTVCC